LGITAVAVRNGRTLKATTVIDIVVILACGAGLGLVASHVQDA
jgi:hypothetical protein